MNRRDNPLTVKQVAQMLGVSQNTVYSMAAAQNLFPWAWKEGVHWRIPLADVETIVNRRGGRLVVEDARVTDPEAVTVGR